jgi:para-nitrobenzyl esterase
MVASLFLILECGYAKASAPPIVTTDSGPVQGVQKGDLTVYKGLPFAAPPVGTLRWRAPQSVTPWRTVKVLDHFGPDCMQKGMYPPDALAGPVSEDCLYLNLWVPPHAPSQKLPVMVWIYGGGLANGSGSIPLYRGDVLAQRGVIVVTLNYRLGVFGFLALPGLAKESPTHTSGNYGLLDQVAALRWVHRNIAAFGGDPSRVTVFGQSSGSISISALSVSPLTKDLFRYVIGESGGLFEPMQLAGNLTAKGAQQDGVAFMRRAGASSLTALRNMSANSLMKVPFTPGIILDGNVVDEPPAEAYRAGRINPSAFMIGSNRDEGVIFLEGKRVTPQNFDKVLARDFPSWVVKIAAPSPGSTPQAAYAAAARFEGDVRFHWDMWTWARLASRAGRPVYVYQFDHSMLCSPDENCTEATPHGAEMPYVFGHDLHRAWSSKDKILSNLMVTCWTDFATTGSPHGCGLPPWPSFSARPAKMVIGDHAHLVAIHPDATMRRLDQLYWAAGILAAHPIPALVVAVIVLLLIVGGVIWLLVLFVRRVRRNPAASRAH